MGNSKTLLLNGLLQVDHEEGSSLRYNIVNISRVSAWVIEGCGSKTINTVDRDLQCIGKSLGILIRQIRRKFSVEHLLGFFIILVLDQKPCFLQHAEPFRVFRSEHLELLKTCGVHTRNIQQSHIGINSLLRIDPSAFSGILPTVTALSVFEGIPWKHLAEIGIDKLALGVLIIPKYNFGGMAVCRVIGCKSGNIRQNQSRLKVRLLGVKYRFCCYYIIVAICSHRLPHIFFYRLIPGKSKLLMVKSEFNLPFFKALFCCAEIINVGIT